MAKWRTKEQVDELLRFYDSRGSMTRRAFCETHRIPTATLGYYLKRRAATSTPRLARVKLTSEHSRPGRFALVLENGRRIECGPCELPQLISAAEHA